MKTIKIRTVREVTLLGDPSRKITTEADARALANFLMLNIPSSTLDRMIEYFLAF